MSIFYLVKNTLPQILPLHRFGRDQQHRQSIERTVQESHCICRKVLRLFRFEGQTLLQSAG